ncbi:hypothetical protein MMC28_006275 [Mycoblastus sanguinarius]|nr:hypothetical protein [Mycoblastus sanguinarius]
MGGFAMDCSGSDDAFLTDDRTRAAITPEGLRFVLDHEPDLLPDILEDQIRDKSKADGLKKTLVCVQAVWFCASCVTRLANRMPISLLELNAMAHAACALLIYLMWWHKPLDVDEPTLLEGFKSDALCAFMWMASRVGARGTKNCDIHGRFLDEFDALWMYRLPDYKDLVFGEEGMLGSVQGLRDRPSGDPNAPGSGPGELSNSLVKSQDNVLDSSIYPRYYRRYSPSDIRYRKWIWFKKHLPCSRLNLPAGMGVRKTAIDHLSLATITRWRLAYRAITQYHLEDFVRKRLHTRSQLYDDGSLLNTRVPNFVSFIGSSFHEVWFGLSIAGVLYGGLHMLAWDAPFSSRVEQIFWRISASSVTLTPLVLAPVMLLPEIGGLSQSALSIMRRFQRRNIEDEGEGKVTDRAAQWAKTVFVGFLIPLLFLGPFFWLLYVTARVFLVVECFKNVAYLPEGVFEDVGWPGYLPHVT